jgi:hypothetical protein
MPKLIANLVYTKFPWDYTNLDVQKKTIRDRNKAKIEKWLQETITSAASVHNTPKQVSFRVSPLFCDVMLAKGLQSLTTAIMNNPVIELHIALPLKTDADRAFALLMATHKRIGGGCLIASSLPIELIAMLMRAD